MWQSTGKKQPPGALALCLLLSVLAHLLLAWGFLSLPGTPKHRTPPPPRPPRTIKLTLAETPPATPPQKEQPAFAKTDPDLPNQRPQEAAYEGNRNARAASEASATPSDQDLPAMHGEEKEETNTLERERQEGPIEYDGKQEAPASSPGAETPPAPPAEPSDPAHEPVREQETATPPAPVSPVPPSPAPQLPEGQDDSQTPPDLPPDTHAPTPPPPGSDVPSPPPTNADDTAPLPPKTGKGGNTDPLFLPLLQPSGTPSAVDPSLADRTPPGFRTYERRSRSTGRFVIGKNPSLNVAATPRGRYEEQIYRRIAYAWYIACDDHRGDIIPGSLTIAIRINKHGRLTNMELINRHGAGVIQQSFTYGAIRQSTLPPMPQDVQQSLIGDLLEIIITFNFE